MDEKNSGSFKNMRNNKKNIIGSTQIREKKILMSYMQGQDNLKGYKRNYR